MQFTRFMAMPIGVLFALAVGTGLVVFVQFNRHNLSAPRADSHEAVTGWHEHDGERHTHGQEDSDDFPAPPRESLDTLLEKSVITNRIVLKNCNEIEPPVARVSPQQKIIFVNTDTSSAHTVSLITPEANVDPDAHIELTLQPGSEGEIMLGAGGVYTYACDGLSFVARIVAI